MATACLSTLPSHAGHSEGSPSPVAVISLRKQPGSACAGEGTNPVAVFNLSKLSGYSSAGEGPNPMPVFNLSKLSGYASAGKEVRAPWR